MARRRSTASCCSRSSSIRSGAERGTGAYQTQTRSARQGEGDKEAQHEGLRPRPMWVASRGQHTRRQDRSRRRRHHPTEQARTARDHGFQHGQGLGPVTVSPKSSTKCGERPSQNASNDSGEQKCSAVRRLRGRHGDHRDDQRRGEDPGQHDNNSHRDQLRPGRVHVAEDTRRPLDDRAPGRALFGRREAGRLSIGVPLNCGLETRWRPLSRWRGSQTSWRSAP
jgi:hypothetical protein